MSDIGKAFIARSRYHLAEDFLPKIEHCLEKLSDEQIWWRANEQSNSIGNLVLHLCGNARQWIVCGVGDDIDGRNRDAEFAQRDIVPRDELFSLLRRTISDVDSTLARYCSTTSVWHMPQVSGTALRNVSDFGVSSSWALPWQSLCSRLL